jgi:hypothetical protein
MSRTISNQDDVIDSRDVIARIEELEAIRDDLQTTLDEATEADSNNEDGDLEIHNAVITAQEALDEWTASDEGEELATLLKLAEEGENSPDWTYGESLISESYFTKYIEELIDDCYEMPKEMDSGKWPYRHMTMDYEAAAEEAKQDYMELDFDGNTYYIRA